MTRKGFTLIELSIVLVIIGLIIGGVLVGRDLIKAAEIRSVIKDIEGFQTAFNTFRLKYNCLPGDCANATDYWPTDASCPTTPTNTVAKQDTCNGTGNGQIQDVGVPTTYYERYRMWQHLANAALIPGSFTGVGGPAGNEAVIGVNSPTSKISGAGYAGGYGGGTTGDAYSYATPAGHNFWLGTKSASCNTLGCASITPTETLSIDQKLDDGLPAYGLVMGRPMTSPSAPNCTTSDTPSLAAYDTSRNEVLCNIVFRLKGF